MAKRTHLLDTKEELQYYMGAVLTNTALALGVDVEDIAVATIFMNLADNVKAMCEEYRHLCETGVISEEEQYKCRDEDDDWSIEDIRKDILKEIERYREALADEDEDDEEDEDYE